MTTASPAVTAEAVALGWQALRAWREGATLAQEWRQYLRIKGHPDGKACRSLAGVLQGQGLILCHQARKGQRPLVRFRGTRPPLIVQAPSSGTPDPDALMVQLAQVLCRPVPAWRFRSPREWEAERYRRRWWRAGFLATWWAG